MGCWNVVDKLYAENGEYNGSLRFSSEGVAELEFALIISEFFDGEEMVTSV